MGTSLARQFTELRPGYLPVTAKSFGMRQYVAELLLPAPGGRGRDELGSPGS